MNTIEHCNKDKLNPYRHYYLYAKGWYKKSKNIINDLKKIQSNYSGVAPEYLTIDDIITVINEIIYPIIKTSEYSFNRLISVTINSTHKDKLLAYIKACLQEIESTNLTQFGNLGLPDGSILESKLVGYKND